MGAGFTTWSQGVQKQSTSGSPGSSASQALPSMVSSPPLPRNVSLSTPPKMRSFPPRPSMRLTTGVTGGVGGNPTNISVNGQRETGNSVLVDGVEVTGVTRSGAEGTVGPDAWRASR